MKNWAEQWPWLDGTHVELGILEHCADLHGLPRHCTSWAPFPDLTPDIRTYYHIYSVSFSLMYQNEASKYDQTMFIFMEHLRKVIHY